MVHLSLGKIFGLATKSKAPLNKMMVFLVWILMETVLKTCNTGLDIFSQFNVEKAHIISANVGVLQQNLKGQMGYNSIFFW